MARPKSHPSVTPSIPAPAAASVARPIAGWGRFPVADGVERIGEDLERLTRGANLTRGLGRSYGDASLPAAASDVVAASPLADRVLSFDAETGVLRAEAGFSLAAINQIFLPRGWFTPVSPGTQFVTLGGMVAADVHGKNHHASGSFGEHVASLRMRVADGRVLDVSDASEPELFRATIGGMGLTGHVLEVEVRLERVASPWIWSESETTADLDELLEKLRVAGESWPFTVGWADCLNGGARGVGRGIVIKGRWATPEEAGGRALAWPGRIDVPVSAPDWLLGDWNVGLFNRANYLKHGGRVRRGVVHPHQFYYPLDGVGDWNRLYGRRGFTQYQCVLPARGGAASVRRFFEIMAERGGRPFLCVVKDMGAEGKGTISFPAPGTTLALDFPIGPDTQSLVDALNDYVASQGGRIYLAKDAFTRAEHFRAMEPRLDAWNLVRRAWDSEGTLRSALSRRLLGDER